MNKILFLLSLFVYGCAQECMTEKVPFTFTPQRRLISVPMSIQGIQGNMLFDTGGGPFDIDTTFAQKIAPYDSITRHGEILVCGGFETGDTAVVNMYEGILNIKIGNHECKTEYFSVGNFKKTLNIPEFDGVFNLPLNDSINLWNLNFEENYISIFPADEFHLDGKFLSLPMKRDKNGLIYTKFPLEIMIKGGKKIRTDHDYLIDTGSIADFTFMKDTKEANELCEYNDSAYWLWNRHFWDAKMTVCDDVKLDSARTYVYDLNPRAKYKRIIGLNFLKRFNVYFDLKNEKMYLQPISWFERITQGKKPWHQVENKIKMKKVFIERIGDYKNNEAIKAGFKVGDEVISINGIKNISSLSPEQERKLLLDNVWNYVVKRKDKILHLKLNRHLENQIDD